MKNFKYIQPKTLKETGELFRKNPDNTLLYAGGTDALGLMKDGILMPDQVVNLKSIPGLDQISYESGKGLKIGSLVKLAQIAEHPEIKQKYPLLAQAAKEVASPQLRNVGTIGGNLCQRPRCWYYRNEFNCMRKGGDVCYAVDGENKYHCVIGGNPCFIVHPSDTAVALLAIAASVVIFNGKKSRIIPLHQFFVLPEQDVFHENILKPGEIITEIQIPDFPANAKSGFIKFKERGAWDFAVVSVAALLNTDGQFIKSGRVVLGGVAPIPWFEKEVSAQLVGLEMNEDNFKKVASEALKKAEPLEKNAYKLPLARNLIKRLFVSLFSS
ncbi:xanthine dehydrogenase family protein subunit M [candidate division KSB1 bacterium]|nr:xanthine dehydrogenase family protein subunit M [candidate division KSB1 bacterium]